MNRAHLLQAITQLNEHNFEKLCLQIFQYQAQHNVLYREFIKLLKISVKEVKKVHQIPFLPISFFKHHVIKTNEWDEKLVFFSSGTTSDKASKHYIYDLEAYTQNAVSGFEQQYGPLKEYSIFALLPSYLEREGSSLVYMVERFIEKSDSAYSGFFLYDTKRMLEQIDLARKAGKKLLLLGVSYALLDLAEQGHVDLSDVIIMETGGMKGRRKELSKEALHALLAKAFNAKKIHSEYGMTELLSQAYSKGDGIFEQTATMRILCRDVTDPLTILPHDRTGGVNIIDLANLDSCSFIATDDLGRVNQDGRFQILGRLDATDLRGCNLLVD